MELFIINMEKNQEKDKKKKDPISAFGEDLYSCSFGADPFRDHSGCGVPELSKETGDGTGR